MLYAGFCKPSLTELVDEKAPAWIIMIKDYFGEEASVKIITKDDPIVVSPNHEYICNFSNQLDFVDKNEYDNTNVGVVNEYYGWIVKGGRYYPDLDDSVYWITISPPIRKYKWYAKSVPFQARSFEMRLQNYITENILDHEKWETYHDEMYKRELEKAKKKDFCR